MNTHAYLYVTALTALALIGACASAPPDPNTGAEASAMTHDAPSEAHGGDGHHHGHHAGRHGHHAHHGGGHDRHHGPAAHARAGAGEHVHHARPHGMPHRFEDAERWSAVFDSPERDAWQQPDAVVSALVDRDDLIVADVGAGTGYFAVRFARAVPAGRVVGIDIEPGMVSFIDQRAEALKLANLTGRLAAPDDAKLGAVGAPVDLVFVCNTYHHIEDRTAYFQALKPHLAPGGRLAIVDFRLDSERGPPRHHKLAPEIVDRELKDAGYALTAQHDFLPDQYLRVYTVAP